MSALVEKKRAERARPRPRVSEKVQNAGELGLGLALENNDMKFHQSNMANRSSEPFQKKCASEVRKKNKNTSKHFRKKKRAFNERQKFDINTSNIIDNANTTDCTENQKLMSQKSQINKHIAKDRRTKSNIPSCNNQSQPKQNSDELSREQYSSCNIEKPGIKSSKRKRRNSGRQFVMPDSNWKALVETLPKREDHSFKYSKRKKMEKQTSKNDLRDGRGNNTGEDVWFDDVDSQLLESSGEVRRLEKPPIALVNEDASDELTKHVAIDCEMVGVGYKGQDSILARVSIVNEFGKCVYDKYVKPREKVTDYRTAVSGVKPHHINSGSDFKDVQKEVADMFKDRIIVGHALSNDLKVLFLGHPRKKIRDTSEYKPFRRLNKGSKPSLKKLAEVVLNRNIQAGAHDSVEDARVAMKLYMLSKKEWEKSIKLKSRGLLKQTKPLRVTDSQSMKDEKRRKIKIFKLRNAQKKKRK